MLLIYNILQVLFLILFVPFLLCLTVCKKKYRTTITKRLGFGLSATLSKNNRNRKKTIWIHALSVGEVTSAVVLIKGIRQELQDTFLVVTTSTKSGGTLAEKLLADHVDVLLQSPIDLFPVVRFFIKKIQPDIFILVETDFWPNLLFSLQNEKIRAYLVNGRISEKSMRSYSRFAFFFRPLFNTFNSLCLQTETDRQNMKHLGINEKKLFTLGNLKYDTSLQSSKENSSKVCSPPKHSTVWVCGSTHNGEEEILFSTYARLRRDHSSLYLILVPRDIGRSKELIELGRSMKMEGSRQSQQPICAVDFHILDTIGQLTALYHQADIAFIGGSLVEQGGHNPIEAAIAGIPVLFGNHMEDFEEISNSLVLSGGAFKVKNVEELTTAVRKLISSEDARKKIGQNSRDNILKNRGVTHRHLELIGNNL